MNKKNNINEIIKKLEEKFNLVKESYVFDEQELPQEEVNGEQGIEDEFPQEENIENDIDSKSMDRVAKIREVALEGLQEYANDINSVFYEFYKKIWQSCDKVMTDKSIEGKPKMNA